MLGMTLAHRLAQAGHARHALRGGAVARRARERVAAGRRRLGPPLPRHAAVRPPPAARCSRELGLEARDRVGRDAHRLLHRRPAVLDVEHLEFLRFPPLGLLDKARLGATILYASRDQGLAAARARSRSRLAARWSGGRTFERIWLPLLRSKLGEAYRETSAAFIWATIARMYAARRSGLKKEMFGYVRGGYARVLDALRTPARGRGRARSGSGSPVARVRRARRRRREPSSTPTATSETLRPGRRDRRRAARRAAVPRRSRADETRRLDGRALPGHRLRLGAAAPAARRLLRHQHHRPGCRSPASSRCRRSWTRGTSAAAASSTCRSTSRRTTRCSTRRTSEIASAFLAG